MKAALKLATENGRRIGKVPKAKRLAAQSATDAARQTRFVSEVYSEAVHVLAVAMDAASVTAAAFSASCGDDATVTRALAREASIAAGYSAKRLSNLLTMMERASRGCPCA